MNAVKRLANGTPATASPMLARTIWTTAVTTYAQRYAANWRRSEPYRSHALRSHQSLRPLRPQQRFALCIKNCCDYHGEQELKQ
jgi:hypothetical protein